MEIESFHVRTIKMFVAELHVVEMTTQRPLAINLLASQSGMKEFNSL